MEEESNIYGTVVKRTVMEEDQSYASCVHDPTTIHYTRKAPRWSSILILSTASMTLGGAIPVGYISGAGINPYHVEDNWVTLDTDTLRSLLLIGGLVGSLVALGLADWFGRRKAVIASSVVGVGGAAFHIVASIIQSSELLVAAWATLGVSIGVCVSVLPLYLVEVAPLGLRSSLGAVFTVGTMIGALLSQILSLHCALGSGSAHPLLLPMFVVTVFVSWILMPRVPESPVYIYCIKKDTYHATEELSRLRGVDIVTADNELSQYSLHAEPSDWSWPQLLHQPTLNLIALVCMAHLGQALCKADQIYHFANAGPSLAEVDVVAATYTASVANCIAALVIVQLISAVSWRVLLIFSTLLSAVFYAVMGMVALIGESSGDLQYLTLASLLIQVVVFDMGLRPIPFFLACELFNTSASATVMAVGGVANFMSQLIADELFHYFGPGHVRMFIAFTLAVLVLILLFTSTENMNLDPPPSNTAAPKPVRRISYTPNPHRTPAAGDRYKRKSEERRASHSL